MLNFADLVVTPLDDNGVTTNADDTVSMLVKVMRVDNFMIENQNEEMLLALMLRCYCFCCVIMCTSVTMLNHLSARRVEVMAAGEVGKNDARTHDSRSVLPSKIYVNRLSRGSRSYKSIGLNSNLISLCHKHIDIEVYSQWIPMQNTGSRLFRV